MTNQVLVPDVGGADEVEVIEVLVQVGEQVSIDDSLVVLESEKASMEIPSPFAGEVMSISVVVGDKVDEGSLILELGLANESSKQQSNDKPIASAATLESQQAIVPDVASKPEQKPEPKQKPKSIEKIVLIPDLGDAGDITVTEILVKLGDRLEVEDSIVVLESDKASMEIPTPYAGVVLEVMIVPGQEMNEGDELIKLLAELTDVAADTLVVSSSSSEVVSQAENKASSGNTQAKTLQAPVPLNSSKTIRQSASDAVKVHAGPAVRKQARQYGVDLAELKGSGRSGRILKEDIQDFVKRSLSEKGAKGSSEGSAIPSIPVIDFTRFGEIELVAMSKIKRATAKNLHRSWLNVPHVTQFDEADITDMEAFRKSQNIDKANGGVKLTPLAFIVKACVKALMKYPQFNASLEPGYKNLIFKKYYNIGIAVETPDGLVVPVLKDLDKKGIIQIGNECGELARLARDKKLPLDAMQGATFTISSLGGIGGTAFTPIVNAPEVAILGVSRSKMTPLWNGNEFTPRLILPLSLSYDHRAIDGAEAARFTAYLSQVMTDVRRLLL